MALKDPPQYVGMDPALIYGVHDLKRETYQRLLQLVGWMWVTRKSGAALGVTVEELAGRWGIAERSVYHTLQLLAAKGYIELTFDGGRAYINRPREAATHNTPGELATHNNRPREVAHYTPGEPATYNTPGEPATHDRPREVATYNRPREVATQQAAGGGNTDCRASRLHGRASSLHENGQSRASSLHEPNSISSSVVVGSDPDQDPELQLQHTIPAAQSAMQAAGVFADRAQALARDPWVTEERVRRWVRQLQGSSDVRSLPAVLYANLNAHREPPEAAGLVGGQWAEFIRS